MSHEDNICPISIIDPRLIEILPEEVFVRLNKLADQAYCRIDEQATKTIKEEILRLLVELREIETCLVEYHFRDRYLAPALD